MLFDSLNIFLKDKGGRPAQAIKRNNEARTTAQFDGNPTYKGKHQKFIHFFQIQGDLLIETLSIKFKIFSH